MTFRKPVSSGVLPLFLGLMLITTGISFAQERDRDQSEYARKYQSGTRYYESSRWFEAASEFREAQEIASNPDDWSRAIYWVILSELAYSDYGSAILDMEELQRKTPYSSYTRDMLYHRARVYYNQGYFDDALLLFRLYIDSVADTDPVTRDRIAAAYFWMGECLYTMVQYDEAEKFYTLVINNYAESPKYEVSLYRIDLMRQKKIEAELLALLQWSHEESLRSSENYQRTIRSYENSLNDYQRRLPNQGAPLFDDIHIDDNASPDDAYARLLERARRLRMEVEKMIDERSSGGAW